MAKHNYRVKDICMKNADANNKEEISVYQSLWHNYPASLPDEWVRIFTWELVFN